MESQLFLWIGLAVAVLLLVTGAPIYVSFGLSSVILLLFYAGMPPMQIPVLAYAGIAKFVLLAIPFFIFSGNIMSYGGPADALINLMRSLIGHVRGGLAVASIAACAFFGALSGSGIATGLAVGGIMVPKMVQNGYPKNYSAAVTATAGTLGAMIPPSIIMVMLGDVTLISVGKIMIAGVLPGLMLTGLLIIVAVVRARQLHLTGDKPSTRGERWRALKHAIPAIFMPLIILGGIYGGVFTATEAAAVAVVYSIIVSRLVYKELNWSNFWKATKASAKSTSAIFLIVATCILMDRVLIFMNIPQNASDAIMNTFQFNAVTLQLFILVFFLFLGMLLDGIVLWYVVLPVFLPAVTALNIDMLPFLIMLVGTGMIALITPPVGVALYATCSASKTDPMAVAKESIPFLAAMAVGLLIIIFVPQLSNILVDTMWGK